MPRIGKALGIHELCGHPTVLSKMSPAVRLFAFLNRNIVAVVMIPSIVLIHWGWLKLQDVEALVKKEEKKDLPVLLIMKAQLEKHNNFGLYMGILVSSMIEQVLSKKDKVAISLATVVIQEILPKLSSILKSDCLKISIDFSSVKQLLHIVNSVLLSKPMCGLTVYEVEPLGVCLVKAFLGSIGEEMGEVIVISGDGTRCDSRLYPGVLYMFDVHDNLLDLLEKQFHGGTEDLLLALFNIMLTNDESSNKLSNDSNKIDTTSESCFNTESEFLKHAMLVIEQAVNSGVKIIACQKVVHPTLRMHLRRKGVLLLDRLGTAPSQAVQKLSGAVPISSLTRYVENLDTMLGRITSVRKLTCDGKEYLHLQREGGNVATLFVNAIGEEATIELKVCVEQSLSLLYQLVSEPVVTPGAGCFDMFIAASLQQVIQEESILVCSSRELRHVVHCLQQSLLTASGLDTSPTSLIAVDSTFKHAWFSSDTSCCCGLIPRTLVKGQQGKWSTLDWVSQQGMFPNGSWFCPTSVDVIKDLHERAIVDLYSSKVNAVMMALESSVNLLGIGMVISRV
uniref:Uncharacterized protein n=1 Tax=Timema bartmani TaxID=61472 RepID=A0A7R9I458_9NEOP|nr:unnamed protein product [Timema bartmani]